MRLKCARAKALTHTCLLAVAVVLASQANAGEAVAEMPPLISDSERDDQYSFLEQQIYAGEADRAQNQLETTVAQIEAVFHRYHEDLTIPLTLLGDALVVQEDYDGALNLYERARHIARVSHGLFDIKQLPIVYREADTFRKIGDLNSAGQSEEYAYEVMHKVYDAQDPALLPVLLRLADFYLETHNYLAARSLYSRAMNVHSSNGTHYTTDAIRTLQGIAQSHKLERFPPFYIANVDDNRLQGPTPRLTTSDLETQHIAFNNFPAGEKALQQIVEIRRSESADDSNATLDAIMALADWHLMFGRSDNANTLYTHIYQKMSAKGEDAAGFFANPKLLYLPRPHDPKPPPVSKRLAPTTGVVTLQFDVATSGRIRKLKTVESVPPKLMDFRVRRSMRLAVYRPSLIEGTSVTAVTQTYSHRFDYFPIESSVNTAAANTSAAVDDAEPDSSAEPVPADES
jgi:tetratricopeptide (TPR) repeat protein